MGSKKVAGLGGGGDFACYYGSELMERGKGYSLRGGAV